MQGSALAATLARQADSACESNLAAAKDQRERIVADAKRAAEKRHNDVIAALRAELDRASGHARTMAHIAAERETLAMRHGLAEDVLAQAKAELDRLADSEAFGPVLEALLAQIMDVCKAESSDLGGMTVLAPAKHVDRVRSWLSANGYGNLAVQADSHLRDGAAVQDANQSFRISHTLSGRYERLENEARALCLKKLFGGES